MAITWIITTSDHLCDAEVKLTEVSYNAQAKTAKYFIIWGAYNHQFHKCPIAGEEYEGYLDATPVPNN